MKQMLGNVHLYPNSTKSTTIQRKFSRLDQRNPSKLCVEYNRSLQNVFTLFIILTAIKINKDKNIANTGKRYQTDFIIYLSRLVLKERYQYFNLNFLYNIIGYYCIDFYLENKRQYKELFSVAQSSSRQMLMYKQENYQNII